MGIGANRAPLHARRKDRGTDPVHDGRHPRGDDGGNGLPPTGERRLAGAGQASLDVVGDEDVEVVEGLTAVDDQRLVRVAGEGILDRLRSALSCAVTNGELDASRAGRLAGTLTLRTEAQGRPKGFVLATRSPVPRFEDHHRSLA